MLSLILSLFRDKRSIPIKIQYLRNTIPNLKLYQAHLDPEPYKNLNKSVVMKMHFRNLYFSLMEPIWQITCLFEKKLLLGRDK